MRNHTLMQTIARANRVLPGKHSGLIVDYANVFASLEKALAIYGAGKNGTNPVKDKQQLVEELRQSVEAVEDALNALISPDPLRRDFFGHERLVSMLYKAVKPDPVVLEFASS